MGHTALILGDQLSHDNPALEGADRVLIVESRTAMTRLRLHRQRRHLVLSSMSTYRGDCAYEPCACPVTALYWDFMARNADAFAHNRRMRGPLAGLRRMDEGRLAALREQASAWADALG